MAVCVRHPDATAVGNCASCHAPFCAGCRVEDIAREIAFCSPHCHERGPATEAPLASARISDADLIVGFHHPIRTGLALWTRTFPSIARHLSPVVLGLGALVGVLASLGEVVEQEGTWAHVIVIWLSLAGIVLLAAYAMALVAVLISRAHTGRIDGSPAVHALRRFAPWAVAWSLFFILSLAGTLALIVPGIIVGIRLFWTDEYALVEGVGPFAALRESWRLTKGYEGPIFGLQFLMGILGNVMALASSFLVATALGLLNEFGAKATLVEPASAVFVAVVLLLIYSVLHAPEVAYFYGLRAHRALQESNEPS